MTRPKKKEKKPVYEPSKRKQRRFAKKFKTPQYLGDISDVIIDELLKYIEYTGKDKDGKEIRHRHIGLTAPAGSGKTTFLFKNLIPSLVEERDYQVIFILPFIAPVEQNEAKGNDSILIYTAKNKQDRSIEDAKPAITCTYDKLPAALTKIKNAAANQDGTILVIDEAQFLTLSQSYRARVLNKIEKAVHHTVKATIYLTATQSKALAGVLKFPEIRVTREKQPHFRIDFIRTSCMIAQTVAAIKHTLSGKRCNPTVRENFPMLSRYRLFVYVNNTTIATAIKNNLVNDGVLEAIEVEIFRGDKTKTRAENTRALNEIEEFNHRVKVVLCTEILIQAVNVQNMDYKQIYLITQSGDKNAARLYQFVNRLRYNIDNALTIDCTVIYGTKTSFDNDISKLRSKSGKELTIEQLAYLIYETWKKKPVNETNTALLSNDEKEKAQYNLLAGYTLPLSAPVLRKVSSYAVGKVSMFAACYQAENEFFKACTLKQFKADFLTYTGDAEVSFSMSDELPLSDEDLENAEKAKDEAKLTKRAAKIEALNNLKKDPEGCRKWYKAIGKDILFAAAMSDIEANEFHDFESEINDYALVIEKAVKLYEKTKDWNQCTKALELELLPTKEKAELALKNTLQYSKARNYALFLFVYQALKTNKQALAPAIEVFYRSNFGAKSTWNFFAFLEDAINSLAKPAYMSQLSSAKLDIEEKIAEKVAKIETDVKNRKRHRTALEELEKESERIEKNYPRMYKGLKLDFSAKPTAKNPHRELGLFERIAELQPKLYSFIQFSPSEVRMFLKAFSNIHFEGNKLYLPKKVTFSLDNYCVETETDKQALSNEFAADLERISEKQIRFVEAQNLVNDTDAVKIVLAAEKVSETAKTKASKKKQSPKYEPEKTDTSEMPGANGARIKNEPKADTANEPEKADPEHEPTEQKNRPKKPPVSKEWPKVAVMPEPIPEVPPILETVPF